jgi:hypothetical protein
LSAIIAFPFSLYATVSHDQQPGEKDGNLENRWHRLASFLLFAFISFRPTLPSFTYFREPQKKVVMGKKTNCPENPFIPPFEKRSQGIF